MTDQNLYLLCKTEPQLVLENFEKLFTKDNYQDGIVSFLIRSIDHHFNSTSSSALEHISRISRLIQLGKIDTQSISEFDSSYVSCDLGDAISNTYSKLGVVDFSNGEEINALTEAIRHSNQEFFDNFLIKYNYSYDFLFFIFPKDKITSMLLQSFENSVLKKLNINMLDSLTLEDFSQNPKNKKVSQTLSILNDSVVENVSDSFLIDFLSKFSSFLETTLRNGEFSSLDDTITIENSNLLKEFVFFHYFFSRKSNVPFRKELLSFDTISLKNVFSLFSKAIKLLFSRNLFVDVVSKETTSFLLYLSENKRLTFFFDYFPSFSVLCCYFLSQHQNNCKLHVDYPIIFSRFFFSLLSEEEVASSFSRKELRKFVSALFDTPSSKDIFDIFVSLESEKISLIILQEFFHDFYFEFVENCPLSLDLISLKQLLEKHISNEPGPLSFLDDPIFSKQNS